MYINKIEDFLAKIATSIVSGLPKEKFFLKPRKETILQERKTTLKSDSERHYHQPMSKPAVEKQTLLKEKKKNKAVH